MAGLPNAKNSEYIENIANEFGLVDPFRILYPEKRDFTYSPFGNVRLNRSRLDFYIISASLVPSLNDCVIAAVPRCKLFDHKNVTLFLHLQNPKKKKTGCN
jgi:exonuclease III